MTSRLAPARVWVPAAATLALFALLTVPAGAFPERGGPDREFPAFGHGPFVLADFNGDGWTDLAAVDDTNASLRVYWGSALGLFRDPPVRVLAPGVVGIGVGDLTGDGRPDLLAVDGQHAMWFTGGSALQTVASLNASGGRAIRVGDLNGDGHEDLVVLRAMGASVWFQRTNGTFATNADLTLSDAARFDGVAVGDLNGDGWDDLALVRGYEMHVYVQDPLTHGLILNDFRFAGTGGAASVVIVDSPGGTPILVCDSGGSQGVDAYVGLWRWNGERFALQGVLSGPYAAEFAVGDLNDDRRPDLAFPRLDGGIAIYLQRSGTFGGPVSDWTLAASATGGGGVAIGDANGDGFNDLLDRTPVSYLVFLQEDQMPSLIRAIPSTYTVNRGTVAKSLIDLRQFFRDDHNRLTFAVVSASDPDHLSAVVDGGALDLTAADWYGSAEFRVSAWDGNPAHPPVESNAFTVLVNDPPAITSVPALRATAGRTYTYIVTVADAYPAQDRHEFSLLAAPEGMTIDAATGLVSWTPTGSQTGFTDVAVSVADGSGGSAVQRFIIIVAPGGSGESPLLLAVGVLMSSAALMAAAALINENAKFAFLLFFLPLYTKIKRERVLDHFVRGQIFGYIQANPGEHYNAIKDALGLTNGSLAHHLRTLERERFIKSKRFGLYRRFYPMNYRMPADDAYQPNEVQATILAVIRDHAGITQKEIAGRLGLTPPTVNYHIGVLSERNLIRVERRGRSTHCSIVEGSST